MTDSKRRRKLIHQATWAFVIAVVFVAVHAMAYWLRFDGQLGDRELHWLLVSLPSVVAIKMIVFGAFRMFDGWGRYLSFHDLVTLGQASIASSLLLLLTDYMFFLDFSIPRSVFLMDWSGTIVAVGGLRAASRFVRETRLYFRPAKLSTPVFIVGTDDSGEALLRSIRHSPRLPFRVAGFIAENGDAAPSRIGGVPVLGELGQICQLAAKHAVRDVLITAGELPGKQVRWLVETCRNCGVGVKVLPSYEQLLRGDVDLQPRTVSIEDLLRRAPVNIDLDAVNHWIEDRTLLVTGSAGSIGSEICRQLLQFNPRRLVLVDRSENGQFFLSREMRALAPQCDIVVLMADINDQQRMSKVFADVKPDIVFHAAAYKHVPLMELNVGEAVKNISLATRCLADLANRHNVESFVMISTDKAVNPTSVMGTCKRVGELYVQSLASESTCRFVTVRFGNVLDSAGSVVPIFREQIARGGPVTVTHPQMTRFFMTIPEASQLVIQAGAMGQGGEIFVLDMGDPVKIVDLASDMIRLSGFRPQEDIEIDFVGVRPGEKLFEELHIEGERHRETSHPKIMVAESTRVEYESICQSMARLRSIMNGPDQQILAELESIVPHYQPSLPAIYRAA